ncbi:hypothetical protein LTR08_004166 [Meristemomyces frigidus]|nr:hypothetical protein LTR08_004166 [Meristemomyces frigidus]
MSVPPVPVEGHGKWPDSVPFYDKRWTSSSTSEPCALLICLHGFAEHIGRYAHVMPKFAERGIEVYGYDQRGFGKSGPANHGDTTLVQALGDLHHVFRQEQQRLSTSGFEQTPIFLYGHSMPPSRLVLALAPWLVWLFPNMPFAKSINPHNLSSDPGAASSYGDDPLHNGSVYLKTVIHPLLEGYRLMEDGYKHWPYDVPILVSHGEKDPSTSSAASKEFVGKLDAVDKEFKVWPDMLHEGHNERPEVREPFIQYIISFIQRHLFYAHKAPIWWSQKLETPESFGFLHNQVLPLRIPTSDGERLFAWLVTPLDLYTQHEADFFAQTTRYADVKDVALRLLNDPESRLVIYFHGNAGAVGNTRRTDAYRLITSGAAGKRVHVLTFDYRGFGHSSGRPTEAGLREDALSVIRWANTVGMVPTERIVLVAQSLGTAVASAALSAIAEENSSARFSGIIMCAAFKDAVSVLTSYRIGGYVPILAPLKVMPIVQRWFAARLRDKWETGEALESFVQKSEHLRLTFVAATCDEVIRWSNTEDMFYAALNLLVDTNGNREDADELCRMQALGDGGTVHEWQQGSKTLKKVIVRYGGHNGIMKWNPVVLEVRKSFEQ